jgi:hypothetical protein
MHPTFASNCYFCNFQFGRHLSILSNHLSFAAAVIVVATTAAISIAAVISSAARDIAAATAAADSVVTVQTLLKNVRYDLTFDYGFE